MKHKWIKFYDQEIYNYSDAFPCHYGTMCDRCFTSWCVACEPERSLDEDCPGNEYEFPGQLDILTGEVVE